MDPGTESREREGVFGSWTLEPLDETKVMFKGLYEMKLGRYFALNMD